MVRIYRSTIKYLHFNLFLLEGPHGGQEVSLGQPKMSKKIGDMGFVRLDLHFKKPIYFKLDQFVLAKKCDLPFFLFEL